MNAVGSMKLIRLFDRLIIFNVFEQFLKVLVEILVIWLSERLIERRFFSWVKGDIKFDLFWAGQLLKKINCTFFISGSST